VNLQWAELYDKLYAFATDTSNNNATIEFPPSLSPEQRKNLHQIAERLNLKHTSVGEGAQRHMVISKKQSQEEISSGKLKQQSKYEQLPIGASEILPGFLFLGSCRDARDRIQLSSLNVKYIVNCAKEWKNAHPEDFIYHDAHLMDVEDQDLAHALQPVFEFIEQARQANERVLVHCVVGKSRSASVVISYLMKFHAMKLREAFHHVKERRSLIQPNEGFMKQLIEMELELYQAQTLFPGDWEPIKVSKPKVAKAKPSSDELQAHATELIAKFLTPNVMLQGIEEACDGSFQKKHLGAYLAWLANFLSKQADLQATVVERGLEWKDISKMFTDHAKEFFLSQK